MDKVRVAVTISEALDRDFRNEVVRRMGWRKGALSDAIEAAMKDWIKKR